MMQPIRPSDATGVYRRQVNSAQDAPDGARRRAGGEAAGDRSSDRVSISDEGQHLSRILDAVSALPEVREARIAAIRQQLAQGSYEVDAAAIAERMVDEGLAT